MVQKPAYSIRTRRLEGGPVGNALASQSGRAEAVAEALLAQMDGEDGWTWRDGEHWWWFPSRLAVQLTSADEGDQPALLKADMHIVTGGSATTQLLSWLSDLNSQAMGWWWWATPDGSDVYCSIKCVAEPTDWWWPLVLFDVLPWAVTVAESMADELARAARGRVCVREHPERGIRPSVDGWIQGCRLGQRDPSASLDQWFFEAELARMDSALGVICGPRPHELFRPLDARIADEDGEPRVILRRHWHPQAGWGWQLAAVTGLAASSPQGVASLQQAAARLNTEQALEETRVDRFGGWAYVEGGGLVHLSFIQALTLDKILFTAGPSIGDAAALMLDARIRFDDVWRPFDRDQPTDVVQQPVTEATLDALREVGSRCGPLGWSYIDHDGVPSIEPAEAADALWTDTAALPYWTVPRHQMICSYGTFNPAGPTVSSLEVALSRASDGTSTYTLYFVMRHPHLPEIRWLGEVDSTGELSKLITDSLTETDPDMAICGAVEWLDIFSMHDAVLDGVRRFAASRNADELREAAHALRASAFDPWSRLGAPTSSKGVAEQTPADKSSPVELWLEAVTDRAVIAGCQLFVRSAWEGSKEFRSGNFEAAQQIANSLQTVCYERLGAEAEHFRALDER